VSAVNQKRINVPPSSRTFFPLDMHHAKPCAHKPPPLEKENQFAIHTMTAPLPTPNTRDYSTQSLRSYRGAAASYLKSREKTTLELDPPSCVEGNASSPPPACGSPPRFRPSHTPSRCRSRTPSPPHHQPNSTVPVGSAITGGETGSKAPRTISPGGTPASCAGSALRRAAARGHRVRWAEDLVVSCYTRPRTLRKDVSALFYSRADELRFRREAATITDDEPSTAEKMEGSSPSSPVVEGDGEDHSHPPLGSPKQEQQRKDYAISKAVVVFGNSTRTYGGCAMEATATVALHDEETESTFFFDDAAFWNGLLTWS
jgi:hypothetical protein